MQAKELKLSSLCPFNFSVFAESIIVVARCEHPLSCVNARHVTRKQVTLILKISKYGSKLMQRGNVELNCSDFTIP